MNLTYGLTSNLTLDGTVNPDFSQVEADAGQIAVNERFALFLPERRPFFLEGTDVFNMPKRLVYTRSIVNPVGAAKISGKIGGTPGRLPRCGRRGQLRCFKPGRQSHAGTRGDVGSSSSIGAVYTDRTEPGVDFNRVSGRRCSLRAGRSVHPRDAGGRERGRRDRARTRIGAPCSP